MINVDQVHLSNVEPGNRSNVVLESCSNNSLRSSTSNACGREASYASCSVCYAELICPAVKLLNGLVISSQSLTKEIV